MKVVEHRDVPKSPEIQAFRRSLAARSARGDGDYWSFRDAVKARDDDVIFQYPAMMVSPMQGALLDVLLEHRESPVAVLDPFMGSGTTLIESMRRGLPFRGSDLNPLAVLLARVETAEAARRDVRASLAALMARFDDSRGFIPAPDDVWTERWFRQDVATELAALQAAIRADPDASRRRLWWASLAEVCRLSGNARLSTPKLQTRPLAQLGRHIDVRTRFVEIAERACGVLERRHAELAAAGYLHRGRYQPGVEVCLADARDISHSGALADVVLTSPPYGDNHTTMPYGQASFLALQWIDLADATADIPVELLATSRSLDTLSLGGSRLTAGGSGVASVTQRSPALADVLKMLEGRSHEAWQRVTSFFIDYDRAWAAILLGCAPDAHLILTLGDRTVRGLAIPTATITRELLEVRGAYLVDTLHRDIPRNKRIANRNQLAETIGTETVLVMQRQS